MKNILICGIESHVCVQQTVLDLLDADFNVHVVVDGVSSRSMVDRSVVTGGRTGRQTSCVEVKYVYLYLYN